VVCVDQDCEGLTVHIELQYLSRLYILQYYPAIQLLIATVILPQKKKSQARGTYYINVEKLGHGAHWRRTYGQQVYSPFLLAFTHEVHLLTL
jgi:hypothetical protein